MKFKVKNGSASTGQILSIEADKDDELAYVDAERVYRGDLDSFLPFSYDREGKSYEFTYYAGAGISLDRALSAPLSPAVLRCMLGSLLHMMQVCEQNGLSRLRVVLDSEYVYYDPTLGMLRFAYVPIRSYVSEVGEAGLISRICSASLADINDQQFAVSVWDFVHRTTILTSVALEDFLVKWGLQTEDSQRKSSRKVHSALGADTRADYGWDFVTTIRQEEARALEEQRIAAAKAAAEGQQSTSFDPLSATEGRVSEARDPRFDMPAQPERRFLLVRVATKQSYILCDGRHVLGRGADCSVSIPDSKGVSRRHAALDVQGEECVLYDLSSTNGVFVNGRRLETDSSMPIVAGTKFVLGEEEFELRL